MCNRIFVQDHKNKEENGMTAQFDPNNKIIRLCLQGMAMEETGNGGSGCAVSSGVGGTTEDFERFYAAYYLGRNSKNPADQLSWLETALRLALSVDDESVASALPMVYSLLAECYNDQAVLKRQRSIGGCQKGADKKRLRKTFLPRDKSEFEGRHMLTPGKARTTSRG
jgi:rifampin ADP-ribosylating transferase